MRAVAWHNGSSPNEAAGYGLKFTEVERDQAFDRSWTEVVVELEGDGVATIALSPSFWRTCSSCDRPMSVAGCLTSERHRGRVATLPALR